MLRRALFTPRRQGKGVSCLAHYQLGCVQPCACPLPQRFSVRAREQVRLVQLRDGLRATPSLDVAAGRGVAVLFLSNAWGVTTAWLRRRFMISRLVGLARALQTQPKPCFSTLGCCGGASSERTSVRMVPPVVTNFLKSTCWKLQERHRRALCIGTFLTCCAVACVTCATATSVARLSSWMGTASYPAVAEVRRRCGLQQQVVVRCA